jgi:hypothetical protein
MNVPTSAVTLKGPDGMTSVAQGTGTGVLLAWKLRAGGVCMVPVAAAPCVAGVEAAYRRCATPQCGAGVEAAYVCCHCVPFLSVVLVMCAAGV